MALVVVPRVVGMDQGDDFTASARNMRLRSTTLSCGQR